MRKRVSILLVVSAVLFCFSGSKVYSKAEKNNDIRDFNKKWRLSFFLGEKENNPGIEKVTLGNLNEVTLPNEEKVWIYEKPFLDRRHYSRVVSQINPAGYPEILVRLNWRGRNAFKDITARNIGKYMLVYWGDTFIARAFIVNEYRFGDIPVTGAFDYDTAKNIAEKFLYKRRLPRY